MRIQLYPTSYTTQYSVFLGKKNGTKLKLQNKKQFSGNKIIFPSIFLNL